MLKKKLKFFTIPMLLIIPLAASIVYANPIPNNINRNSKGVAVFTDKNFRANKVIKSTEYTKTYLNTNKIAPSTFNPITATNDELKKYGFPSKPTDKKKLNQWEKALSHAKKYVSLKAKQSNITHGTYNSTNWSGYVNQSSTNNNIKFFQTSTEFVLPQYSGSKNDDPAFWTGIGGFNNSSDIVQAGADVDATGLVPGGQGETYGGSSQYQFWIEDYPEGVSYITGISINPGNTLFVNVEYSPSSKVSYGFFENETTGEYGSIQFDGKYYDGSSADSIYEATDAQYHGSWGHINFIENVAYYNYNASTGTGNSAYIGSLNPDTVILNNNQAVPSAINDMGGFTINTY